MGGCEEAPIFLLIDIIGHYNGGATYLLINTPKSATKAEGTSGEKGDAAAAATKALDD